MHGGRCGDGRGDSMLLAVTSHSLIGPNKLTDITKALVCRVRWNDFQENKVTYSMLCQIVVGPHSKNITLERLLFILPCRRASYNFEDVVAHWL